MLESVSDICGWSRKSCWNRREPAYAGAAGAISRDHPQPNKTMTSMRLAFGPFKLSLISILSSSLPRHSFR